MQSVRKMGLSGDHRIDGILSGYDAWDGSITFSTATGQSVWPDYPNDGLPFQPEYAVPNAAQSAAIRKAMATMASYIALPLTEVPDNATSAGSIRVAFSLDPQRPTASLGTYPGIGTGGDIWLNNHPRFTSNYEVGSGYYFALMHEIAHTLGLKHPFEGTSANRQILDAEQNTRLNTIMAYENVAGKPTYATTFFATTPMVYDVLALQHLYGKNTSFNAGDTTYRFSESGVYYETIYDAAGLDTFAYTGKKAVSINLNQGQGSYVGQENWIWDMSTGQKIQRIPNVWIAYETLIRNASGGEGNDTLVGNRADNSLSGGAGVDTVVYDGKFASYTLATGANGTTVTSQADGTDTLAGIERLRFADAAVAWDHDGVGGQAYRIYQAAFNRAPDAATLGYWISAMDKGMALPSVAASFIASDEFKTMYGANPTHKDVVTKIYANVLHRTADEQGYAYWVELLESNKVSPTDVLVAFSESAENQAALIGVIGQGVVYTPYG